MRADFINASRYAIAVLAIGVVAWGAAPGALAQSIDLRTARSTLGDPLLIEVRVRHPLAPEASVTPRCVYAEAQLGDAFLGPDELRLHIRPDVIPGWQIVRLTHPSPVQEPVIHTRIVLTCGAQFVREFYVLVDPLDPDSRGRASLPEPVAPTRSKPAALTAPATDAVAAGEVRRAPLSRREQAPETTGEVAATAPFVPRQMPTPPNNGASTFLLKELEELRAENRHALTQLSSMEARLGQRDRMLGSTTWQWLLAALAVSLFGLTRIAQETWRARRPMRSAKGKQHREIVRAPARPADNVVPPSSSAAIAPSDASLAGASEPKERSARWANVDFGQASFEAAPDPAFIQQLEKYESLGFPVASVALLEKSLGEGPGKNPWILLKLLDLYTDLGQTRQREGVAAQLEALYNVQISVHDGRTLEGRSLLEQPETLSHISASWHSARAREVVESLLSHPVTVEPLDLGAFRDAMLLHAIARAREDDAPSAGEFNPLIDWPST